MRSHITARLVSAALIVAAVPAIAAGTAEATQAPVAFTSVALPTYQTNGVAWAVASAQGKTFVGGTFSAVRPPGSAAGTNQTTRTNFVVLDSATGTPTSCAPAFLLPTNPTQASVRALDVSPDGQTLYIGGSFSSAGGSAKQYLAAMTIATCTIVSGFTPLPSGVVRAITSTSSVVYYGGDFSLVGGLTRKYAAAATAVGQTGAGARLAWAPTFDKPVLALNLRPDLSQVVVGGRFDTVNGAASHALAVVDPSTGGTVKAFGTFVGSTSVVKSIAVDATGFYTGHEGTGSGSFDGRIAVNWSSLGQRWRDYCQGATQAVVVYRSVLYVGSHAHDCSMMGGFPDGSRNHLLAESLDKPTFLSWFPQTNDGIAEMIGPRAMVVASSGGSDYMYVVGEFTTVNTVAQQGITRFGQGTDTAAPTTPLISVSSPGSGQARVAWRTSLDTDDSTLTYRVYRDAGATPIYTTTATSWFWNRQQQVFTDTGQANGSVHSYKVSASDGTNVRTSAATSVTVGNGGSGYANRVLADGATMYLRYDEPGNTFIADASANRNNVTLVGTAVFRAAPAISGSSRALTLTGTTTQLYGETRFGAMSTYSLETWFKTTSTVGGKLIGLGNKQNFGSYTYDKMIYMGNGGKLNFGVHPSGTNVVVSSPSAYNNGAWHHVVATQSSAGMALYVDGVKVASNTTTTNQSYNGYWHVGGDTVTGTWPDRPTSSYFQGSLDETAAYPSALSASTVAAHYGLR